MNKLLKLLKQIRQAGAISDSEKAEVTKLFTELDSDSQSTLKEDVDTVLALKAADAAMDEEIQKGLKKLISAGLDELAGKFRKELQDWMTEQKSLMETKSGIYHPDVKLKRAKMNDYLRKFVSAASQEDVETMRTLNGGVSVKELSTDATGSPYGGYVVDSELAAEIHHLITEHGVARREFTTVQLSKNSYKANNLATDISVAWVDEGGAIASKQVVLGQESLELKKLAAIVTLTSELLEDQEIDLFAFIGGRIAEKFAEAEDEAFFDGDGTSTYGSFTGLLRSSALNTVTMDRDDFDELTADHLLDMQDATPAGAHANAKYYLHRTNLSTVRKLKDEQGQYIYQAPANGLPGTIWDKPYVLVEAMPAKADTANSKAFVLFGDLKKAAILGFKGGIAVKRFDSGVVRNVAANADINLITTDREAVRWTERVGYIRIVPTAATRLRTSTAS